MRPFFKPDSCSVDGLSSAGNPLSRAFDALTAAKDKHHAQQLREGYLGGMRPPMGPLGGQMLDPMRGDMESAWRDAGAGPMGPRPMGPGMGAAMSDQFRQHMEAAGPMASEPGFFDGPAPVVQMPHASDPWAQEFASAGPSQGFGPMVHGPRPHGPDWAMEFKAQQNSAPLDAAWQQASAAPGQMASSSAMGPTAMSGPMGPMMGPMMGMSMHRGPGPMAAAPVAAPVVADAAMKEAKVESAPQETAQVEEADLEQAAQMVDMLRNSGNPKLANSRFVSFIDKVSKGELQFKENTVIDRAGNQVDWDSLYDTDVATATASDQSQLENLWKKSADPASMEQFLGSTFNKADADRFGEEGDFNFPPDFLQSQREALEAAFGSTEEADRMMEQMMEGLPGYDPSAMNIDAINRGRDYTFAEENPFREVTDPLAEALRLIREGRDREALLCLEAEVQRNTESSEGWRLLGQLYAELDQDIEAIQCLRKGHEVDPYNLDSLLALGVSCTNELDQLPALRYLRTWIENHEEYQALLEGMEPPPEFEYEAWRRQVTEFFQRAADASPNDPDVFVALGVLQNINRNFDAAIEALARACRLRPNDHTVWNKLGATLANSGKSEPAVVAYHQGLELKPNYARSWSNMAIAHANLGKHKDAARLYLSSLVLNPDATHIWNFLQSAVLNMNMNSRYALEATEAIDQRDLKAATQIIEGVLDPAKLPKPLDAPLRPPDETLSSIGL